MNFDCHRFPLRTAIKATPIFGTPRKDRLELNRLLQPGFGWVAIHNVMGRTKVPGYVFFFFVFFNYCCLYYYYYNAGEHYRVHFRNNITHCCRNRRLGVARRHFNAIDTAPGLGHNYKATPINLTSSPSMPPIIGSKIILNLLYIVSPHTL